MLRKSRRHQGFDSASLGTKEIYEAKRVVDYADMNSTSTWPFGRSAKLEKTLTDQQE